MLTQFARLSEQTKLSFRRASVSQTTKFIRGGSILAGDIYGEPGSIVTNLDVDSDEPVEKVASIVKLAEQSCFALQSMMQNTPVSATATLRGKALPY
mgnify:CR=1 FL=1|jgi:hypothetical protein